MRVEHDKLSLLSVPVELEASKQHAMLTQSAECLLSLSSSTAVELEASKAAVYMPTSMKEPLHV